MRDFCPELCGRHAGRCNGKTALPQNSWAPISKLHLDADSVIGIGTPVFGLINDFRKLPASPVAAGVWGADLIVNKTSLISGLLPSSHTKSYAEVALGVAGTTTSVLGDSIPLAFLAGYGLGSAINNFPIGNSNIQNILSDTIWSWRH